MAYQQLGLPEKELKKTQKDLLDLHKRVLVHYLTAEGLEYPMRKKFFKIYDYYIHEDNVRFFFHRPCRVFVIALLKGELDTIGDIPKHTSKRKSRKK